MVLAGRSHDDILFGKFGDVGCLEDGFFQFVDIRSVLGGDVDDGLVRQRSVGVRNCLNINLVSNNNQRLIICTFKYFLNVF